MENSSGDGYRSGFGCLVGRPNAGKSTLINALVGQKIAITSSKPETTRHSIRGVVTRPNSQLILIDTPGLHRPRSLLGERLNDIVRDTWSEVDVIGICFPAQQKIGPGDEYLVSEIAKLSPVPKLVAILTKSDLVSRERLAKHLAAVSSLQEKFNIWFDAFIPCAAITGSQVDAVRDEFLKLLPNGPQYYPDGEITDEPVETLVAELIRESALEGLRDELPHSLAVQIDEMGERAGRGGRVLMEIYAALVVERESQKGIVIGKSASMLKQIGSTSRTQIEHLLGISVNLQLKVKVLKDWQRDTKNLNRLGF